MNESFFLHGTGDTTSQSEVGKKEIEQKEKKLKKEKLFRNFCWGLFISLNGAIAIKSTPSSSEKNMTKDKQVAETSIATPEQKMSNNQKLVYFFANNEVYEMRGEELKNILNETTDYDLVESFYRGRIATSQYLEKKVTDQYPEHEVLEHKYQKEFKTIDSLEGNINAISDSYDWDEELSTKDSISIQNTNAKIDTVLSDPIINTAIKERQRYEELWNLYNWRSMQAEGLVLSMSEMRSHPEDVQEIAQKIRTYLNTVVDEYQQQATWIRKTVYSEEYKKRLATEGPGILDSVYKSRMDQINQDFLIYNTQGFTTNGGSYNNAMAYYDPATLEIYLPTGIENAGQYLYSESIDKEAETNAIHEMAHQATDGRFLMSDYAKELYAVSFDSTKLSSYEKGNMDYCMDVTERDARKKVLEYEMEQLGIKKYGEPFTDAHLELLERLQSEEKLSSDSDEFLRMTKKEYIKQIMNTIARNESEAQEEMLFASHLHSGDDQAKNIHLFEVSNPEKAKEMRALLG